MTDTIETLLKDLKRDLITFRTLEKFINKHDNDYLKSFSHGSFFGTQDKSNYLSKKFDLKYRKDDLNNFYYERLFNLCELNEIILWYRRNTIDISLDIAKEIFMFVQLNQSKINDYQKLQKISFIRQDWLIAGVKNKISNRELRACPSELNHVFNFCGLTGFKINIYLNHVTIQFSQEFIHAYYALQQKTSEANNAIKSLINIIIKDKEL